MNGKRTTILLALGLAMTLIGNRIARADGEMVDNPEFTSWAKFKVGTAVTYSRQMSMGGDQRTMDTTSTLTEVTPDHVTLENKTTMSVNGTVQNIPAQTRTINAKVAKGSRPDEPHDGDAKPETGTEDIQAAGKTFSCKWMKITRSEKGTTVTMKFWRSDDVPGGLVKMDLTGSATMTTTLTALDVK
jgi:hypothetical protein